MAVRVESRDQQLFNWTGNVFDNAALAFIDRSGYHITTWIRRTLYVGCESLTMIVAKVPELRIR